MSPSYPLSVEFGSSFPLAELMNLLILRIGPDKVATTLSHLAGYVLVMLLTSCVVRFSSEDRNSSRLPQNHTENFQRVEAHLVPGLPPRALIQSL